MVEKVTRGGKRFYGCSNYPKCTFATWDKPVATACPVVRESLHGREELGEKGRLPQVPEVQRGIHRRVTHDR